jgi:hypothetical protein
MPPRDLTVSLAKLATKINSEHRLVRSAAGHMLKHALAAGDLLIEAKEQLPHGEWLPWFESNCPDISPRTAQVYMQLARNRFAIEANAQSAAHLSLAGALKLLAAEDDGIDKRQRRAERERELGARQLRCRSRSSA